jgi:hypothetical protein
MLTSQLVQRLRLFYRSKTIFATVRPCMAKFQAIICHRSCWNQNVGAPICSQGYSWKESEKENHGKWRQQEKTKKYEENRKACKFNVKWLTNREWLDYDESNDIMTCKIWQRWWWWWLLWRLAWWSWKLLAYMNIQENKILHLNCVNFYWSSKKLFGSVNNIQFIHIWLRWFVSKLLHTCLLEFYVY